MKKKVIFLLFFILCLIPKYCFAQNTQDLQVEQFITIVNPVRISSYSSDPVASFKAQYEQIKKRDLPASWLVTFDVLEDDDLVKQLKTLNQKQEVGIFMEISEKFAKKANVTYNKTDSWHRANSVFLSGYTQDERTKLIGAVFEEFKEKLGYYPSSVGAWWNDSYSLDYMAKKYGVRANLTVSDQFSTDGYQVFGQYWSSPFYPSKYHSGMPATTLEDKLDIVELQWAARDPLNGYFSPTEKRASLYSTQDYFTLGLSEDYLEKLVNLYTQKGRNEFGQITLGLEGDFSPQTYNSGNYITYLDSAKKLSDSNQVQLTNMGQFSDWYRKKFPKLTSPYIIETDDLLGKKIKVVWYQSPDYRVGLLYDFQNRQTKIFDLRTYSSDFEEPYYYSPNRDLDLTINIPSLVDQADNENDFWLVSNDEIESVEGNNQKLEIKYKGGKHLIFEEKKISFNSLKVELPTAIQKATFVNKKNSPEGLEISFNDNWLVGRDGQIKDSLNPKALYFLKSNKVKAIMVALIGLFLVYSFFVLKRRLTFTNKVVLTSLPLVVFLVAYSVFIKLNSEKYFVNEGEVDALFRLSALPEGKVLVFDGDCLQCQRQTIFRPEFFINDRDYVSLLSGKKTVKNKDIIRSSVVAAVKASDDREKIKKELKDMKINYIYLVKFEDYKESLPFSPGDLGVEMIYSNANAEIWRVK